MRKEKVLVLMSAYNGEKYIREQVESILKQSEVEVHLLIRDDGSKDGTVEILKSYENYNNIEVYQGGNLGACQSFFDLMQHASTEYSYYAFADQDDVWQKDKLKTAIHAISGEDRNAVLYCGTYQLTDCELRPLPQKQTAKNISFGNALIECNCTGCTAVFNKRLLELAKQQIPREAYMHDWWLYLMASAFGKVVYDETPHMMYRQHGSNVLGGNTGKINQIQRRIKNFRNLSHYVPAQLEEFERIFENQLTKHQKHLIHSVTNRNRLPWKRLGIFREKEIRRNSRGDDLVYKGMFLVWRV